ncbi:MAG TPA: FkbM family methyltransferase [Solirubrobacterales bacterium]
MPTSTNLRSGRPYGLKAMVARTGPLYRWARRLRALSRYLARRPHDPDFRAFGGLEGEGLFLDIGASIGQSALSFRIFNRDSPILSLEPLPAHRDDLRFVRRVLRGHRFMIAGAAAESRRATLYVPMLGSYELPAESSLSEADARAVLERLAAEGANRDELRLEKVEVDLRRVDELGLEPAFVKIDVEGAELGVLAGLRETIERCQPVLMIERSERIPKVIQLLGEEGYGAFVYDRDADDFEPYREQSTVNVFFLPRAGASLRGERDRR